MKTAPDKVKYLARGGFMFRVGRSTGGGKLGILGNIETVPGTVLT